MTGKDRMILHMFEDVIGELSALYSLAGECLRENHFLCTDLDEHVEDLRCMFEAECDGKEDS